MTILYAVLAGILVGVSLGALGGGGAIITVPVLVFALGQTAHQATTGSLVIVGVTAAVAAVGHARHQRVKWAQGAVFGALGTAGTAGGSRLSAGIEASVLLLGFAALLLLVAVLMWRRSRRTPSGEPDEHLYRHDDIVTWTPHFHCDCPRALRVVVTATGVGLLTGFFGVGGGFAIVPALVMVLGFSMPVAVGTSLLVIAVNSATALVARLGGGVDIDWALISVFTGAALAGSQLGSRVMSRVPGAVLQQAFSVLLLVVASYTGVRSLLSLLG
jgi:uncharacterized membrane protein YfcA